MVIEPVISIGYKCGICGRLNINKVNLFDISSKGQIVLKCDCGDSEIWIEKKGALYVLKVTCFDCESMHSYAIKSCEIMSFKNIVCPNTGNSIFYLGAQKAVIAMLEKMEGQLNIIAEKMGLKSQFTNQDVMIQVLDRIHEYAKRDNIICSCGNPLLTIKLSKNGVLLTCERCYDSISISAGNIQDLIELNSRDFLQLSPQKNQRSK